MKSSRLNVSIPVIVLVFFLGFPLHTTALSNDNPVQTAEGIVKELYDLVTFDAGRTPDWDKVKSLFIDKGVVVLRMSREGSTVFSVQGFVDEFVRFIERSQVEKSGFIEEIKRMKSMIFGDIATVLVLYEASIPGRKMKPQQGVDSFSLMKKNGRWWIVSIINELPTSDRPLPQEIQ